MLIKDILKSQEHIDLSLQRLNDRYYNVKNATETYLEKLEQTIKINGTLFNPTTVKLFEDSINNLRTEITKENNKKKQHLLTLIDNYILDANVSIENSINSLLIGKLNKNLNGMKNKKYELKIDKNATFLMELINNTQSSSFIIRFSFDETLKLLDSNYYSRNNICEEIYANKNNLNNIFKSIVAQPQFLTIINNLKNIRELKKQNSPESLKFMKEFLFDKPLNSEDLVTQHIIEITDFANLHDIKINQPEKNEIYKNKI